MSVHVYQKEVVKLQCSYLHRVLTTLENLENSGNFLILENSGNFKFTQGISVSVAMGIEFCA